MAAFYARRPSASDPSMQPDYAPPQLKTFRTSPPPAWHSRARMLMGAIGGAAAGINAVTESYAPGTASVKTVLLHIVIGAIFGVLVAVGLAWATRRLLARVDLSSDARLRYLRGDFWTYTLLLTPLLGAAGVQFVGP